MRSWEILREKSTEVVGKLHRELMRVMGPLTANPTVANTTHSTAAIPSNHTTLATKTGG